MAKEWWEDAPVVGETDEPEAQWWAEAPLVDAKPKSRTWGEAAEDTGRGIMSGAAGLVKSGGDLYGLATGNMDNAASQLGRNAQEHWESGQSQALKAKKDARRAAIDAQEGIGGKAWEALKGTVTDPALAADAVATNIATLIPGMAVGRLASGMKFASGMNAASKLGPANIPAIANAAGSFGTKAAIGAGAVQQGADVAGDVYESAMKKPDAAWAENPEFNQLVQASDGSKEAIQAIKHELALKAARLTLPAASAISVAANAIPGASMLERTLVGGAARETLEQGAKLAIPKAIAKGALGEMAQEGIEEGGGAFSGNVAKRGYVDPAQDLREGVGENAGMGMAGGFLLGGAGGAGHRVAPKPATGNTATGTPAQPTSPPTLAIGNTPDPMIGFPDGTVARKSEVEAYIASLPEDQRTAARAGMMGLAQQPAKVDPVQSVMATSSVDDAIAAAQAAVSDDQSDLSDLVQSESRNLQVLQAQIAQDRIKQEQLAQLHSQSVEALGRLPDQQVAAARAATDESPTAMQLAMQRAQEAAARPRAEPAQKLQPAPLGLENQPDPLIAFPDGSVARRGEVESYINSLPANQQTSARAKLMGFGQQKANDGTTDAVQPVPATGGGVASPVAPESVGTGTADGKRLGADAEGSGNSGLAEPGVRTNVDAAPALDQRLVPLSKRNVQNTAPRANPEATQAAPVEAPAPAGGQPVAATGVPGTGSTAVQPVGVKPVDQRLVKAEKRNITPTVDVEQKSAETQLERAQAATNTVANASKNTQSTPTMSQGPEVSRYTGKFGKGMGKDAARMEAQRLNRANDGITYTAEEHDDPKLENPYAVVGRKVETPKSAKSKTVEQKQPVALVEPAKTATENVANDAPVTAKEEAPEAPESQAKQEPDTGSDIPPRYFKNVKVDHQVWIEDERKSETHKVSAKDALASIKEDLDNYKKLLQCMTKG